jgi:sarcosine oxidase subunit alpha
MPHVRTCAMTVRRLPPPAGTRLDRTRRISFTFNGRKYSGFQGDTLASALFANEVRLVGRSFKLHRPRGIYSCGIEEPTGLVDLGVGARRTPNARASVVEIYDGLIAQSVNCWPNVHFDLAAMNSWFSAATPGGFYYKTFKWPGWYLFEPAIRRLAGLGRISRERDPDRYEEIAVNADVLVVGGGIGGMAAAIAAAEAGAQTMLLTSAPVLGGALSCRSEREVFALVAQSQNLGIRTLTRTTAFGIYDHNLVCGRQWVEDEDRSPSATGSALRQRLWKIRARAVITATGAFERPMVFPDNDRPGVMLAGAVEKYAHAYGVACGSRVVIAANCDRAYAIGSTLREFGLEVVAIVDCRPDTLAHVDRRACTGIVVANNAAIASVSGRYAVQGCSIASFAGGGGKLERFDCDLILSAGGLAPAVHLHSQAGGKLRWLDEAAMFVPDGPAPGVVSVGACAGVFVREDAVNHASSVGTALARGTLLPVAPVGGAGRSLANTHVPRKGAKQFIDLQSDVTADDVALAARENYRSVEHLKRYTSLGMGTDQGKTSNINAILLMAEQTGRAPAAVGTTKFRPPFAPITMGVLAGRRVGSLYRPLKRLPTQGWHEARGAVFEEYSTWWRPAAYPLPGESLDAAVLREATGVRHSVGIFDGTPLGKLEIFGPDAATFLDLMYVGTVSTLAIGQARYGLLLNENGVVVDDGIVARLSEQHFWINTTSGGVERTAVAFEEWLQCEFVSLKVTVTPVTSRWVNATIAGPRAWEWLEAAGFDAALAPNHIKHMSIAVAHLEGLPLRVLRASFSGELAYEVNVPVDYGRRLFDRLWALGTLFNAVPYGIEALQTLRIEKGYIHIGTDTDGTTLPGDIGLGRTIDRKIANFVGRRSLSRPAARDRNRLHLVALVPADGRTLLPVGAQIAQARPPTRTEGHVTSSAMSPALGRPIALAMLARGSTRTGERVRVHHLGKTIEADVVTAPFVDPRGLRLHG